MGELADRLRALDDIELAATGHELALIAAAVEELEDGRDGVIARQRRERRGEPAVNRGWIANEVRRHFELLDRDIVDVRRQAERRRLIDEIENMESRTAAASRIFADHELRVVPGLEKRAIAAEQRADALLAAVSRLVQSNGKVILAYAPVDNEPLGRNKRFVCADERPEIALRVEVENHGPPRRLSVYVIETDAVLLPDLLERASVELAEEYQRVKAKEQQEAEAKALTQRIVAEISAHHARFGRRPTAVRMHPNDAADIAAVNNLVGDGALSVVGLPVTAALELSRGQFEVVA